MVVLASGWARAPQSLALGPLTPRKLLLELGWLHSLEALVLDRDLSARTLRISPPAAQGSLDLFATRGSPCSQHADDVSLLAK